MEGCELVFAQLVKVLWLVDGDKRPSMGLLVGGLEDAKKEIKERLKNNVNDYKPISDIIKAKAKKRLDSPFYYVTCWTHVIITK